MRAIAAVLVVTLLTACEGERSRPGGNTARPRDASTSSDGGEQGRDATDVDAQTTTDATLGDASNTDGSNTDGSNTDGSNTDASNVDAGNRDAGNPDASNFDAGNRDAGNSDAGTRDAGNPDASPLLVPSCRLGCSTAADCTAGTSVLYDADNYACPSGYCEYTGCNSDAECVAGVAAGHVCRVVPPFTIRSCLKSCTTPADCAVGTSSLFDADNYNCTANVCIWAGCNTTGECTSAFSDPAYTCAPQAGLNFDNCQKTCSTAADCDTPASPLYDLDNYSCPTGLCEWTGCRNTSECTSALNDPRYVCR